MCKLHSKPKLFNVSKLSLDFSRSLTRFSDAAHTLSSTRRSLWLCGLGNKPKPRKLTKIYVSMSAEWANSFQVRSPGRVRQVRLSQVSLVLFIFISSFTSVLDKLVSTNLHPSELISHLLRSQTRVGHSDCCHII